MSVVILTLAILNSFLIVHLLFKPFRLLTKIGFSIPIGIVFLGSILFFLYAISKSLPDNPLAIILLLVALFMSLLLYTKVKFEYQDFKLNLIEAILIISLLLFSSWLMFGSFSYSKHKDTLNIGSHLWSDFGAHIPLIRSFSLGENFPPEFPLFANESIRYHFLFYFLTGQFEKYGENIALSLNLLSTLSFFSFSILIFELAKNIFGKYSAGLIAIMLTFLNSSLSFVLFFKNHSLLNLDTYKYIWQNNRPLANGPYENDIITTFWSLNIYLNQRHLALAFAIALIIIYILYQNLLKGPVKTSQLILVALLFGLLPYWHVQVFIMVVASMLVMSLIFIKKTYLKQIGIFWVFSIILILPQIYLLKANTSGESSIFFRPGYLTPQPLTIFKTFFWWFMNLGFASLLVLEAILIQQKNLWLFYISFIPIFLLGFLFQFSPDIATNHKFFNFWLIITNLFIAAFLTRIFSISNFGKIIAIILFILLTLSGILELAPIKNDSKIEIKNWRSNPVSLWVNQNASKSSTFLTSMSLYHPVSLAGRKVFLGWPYFAWSAGSDTGKRGEVTKLIYFGNDKSVVCKLLYENKIDYVVIEEGSDNPTYSQNKLFFDNNFEKEFVDSWGNINYSIYDGIKSCHE